MKQLLHSKYYLLILISVFLLAFNGKGTKNTLTKENLKGSVKSLSVTYYNAKDTNGAIKTTNISSKYTSKFNVKGNPEYLRILWYDGRLQRRNDFIYEKDNLCLIKYDSGIVNSIRDTFIYDNKNTLIKMETLPDVDDGTLYGKYEIYKYDNNQNIIEKDGYDYNLLNEVWTYTYDAKGNIIVEKDSDKSGFNHYISISKYDITNNLIESRFIGRSNGMNRDTILKSTYKYENYDKNGNWLKEISIQNDTEIQIIERKIEYY